MFSVTCTTCHQDREYPVETIIADGACFCPGCGSRLAELAYGSLSSPITNAVIEKLREDPELVRLTQGRIGTTPAVVGGWRPIDSAPKDGTEVLVWSPDPAGCFLAILDTTSFATETWLVDDDYAVYPTHWQPLPPPPEDCE